MYTDITTTLSYAQSVRVRVGATKDWLIEQLHLSHSLLDTRLGQSSPLFGRPRRLTSNVSPIASNSNKLKNF